MVDPAKLQALVDKDEIRDVMWRYARAVDRGDVDLLRTCYHPDATLDYGRNSGDGSVEAHLETVAKLHSYVRAAHHHISNVFVELDGDFATVESYLIDTLSQAMDTSRLAADQEVVHQLFARYLDRFERRDGEWRIIRRVVVKDLRDVRTFVDFNDGYRRGACDRSDVCYDPMRK